MLIVLSFSYGDCFEWGGSMYCNGGVKAQINTNGNVTLDKIQVIGDTTIRGQLFATGVQFSSLNIYGNAILKETFVGKQAKILGFLQARKSEFKEIITIFANNAKFTACRLQSIIVTNSQLTEHKIELLEGSVVLGNIEFKSGDGIVYLSENAQIHGKVLGGIVKKI